MRPVEFMAYNFLDCSDRPCLELHASVRWRGQHLAPKVGPTINVGKRNRQCFCCLQRGIAPTRDVRSANNRFGDICNSLAE